MKRSLCFWLLAGIFQIGVAQTFYPIWNNNMPNSKGITVKDSIANERVYQVGTPGVYVFEPSKAENKKTAVLLFRVGDMHVWLIKLVDGSWLNGLIRLGLLLSFLIIVCHNHRM